MTFEMRPGALMGVPFWFNACRNTSTKDTMVLHQFKDHNLKLDLKIHLSPWFRRAASVSATTTLFSCFQCPRHSLDFVMICWVSKLLTFRSSIHIPFCTLCMTYTILYCMVVSHKHCASPNIQFIAQMQAYLPAASHSLVLWTNREHIHAVKQDSLVCLLSHQQCQGNAPMLMTPPLAGQSLAVVLSRFS